MQERAKGIEPSFSAWEADVLPLNYARWPAQHYRAAPMVLSDRSIREALKSGEIVIDPLGDDCVQPSSVDLHVDRYFRLFRNHTMRVIDVREDLEDLTELVDVPEGDALILHPGGVRPRLDAGTGASARRPGRAARGEVLARPSRSADPLDRRFRRRRVGRSPHPGALQRRQPADHGLSGYEDRADQLPRR